MRKAGFCIYFFKLLKPSVVWTMGGLPSREKKGKVKNAASMHQEGKIFSRAFAQRKEEGVFFNGSPFLN